MDPLRGATDEAMMARCIELSRDAIGQGEYPFFWNAKIIVAAANRTMTIKYHQRIEDISNGELFLQ